VKIQRTSSKNTKKSLKILTDRLKSLPSQKSPNFNKDSPYLQVKEKIIKKNKNFLEKQSVDHLIKVIDNSQNINHEFLTEDLMKTSEIKKALKFRKRTFGFKKLKTTDDLNNLDLFVDLIDEKKRKMLSKILYNQHYMKNSEFERENPKIPRFNSNRSSLKLSPISLSPTMSRALSPEQEENDLKADYLKTILKEDRETDLKKFRLSRYLSMKGVFNLI
jgi:hypothetical protein